MRLVWMMVDKLDDWYFKPIRQQSGSETLSSLRVDVEPLPKGLARLVLYPGQDKTPVALSQNVGTDENGSHWKAD